MRRGRACPSRPIGALADHVGVLRHGRLVAQMPREELVWRMHFMFGTLSYTLAATDTVQLIAGCKPEDRYDARLLEDRLTAFLAAGLEAPLKQTVRKAA